MTVFVLLSSGIKWCALICAAACTPAPLRSHHAQPPPAITTSEPCSGGKVTSARNTGDMCRMVDGAATCADNPSPQQSSSKPSEFLDQKPPFQITVDISASNFHIAFVVLFLAFIAYLVWDFRVYYRNLQLRSVSD
jgi:hypothetical protein